MAKPCISVRDTVRKRAHNCCERCRVKIRKNKAGYHNGSFHHRKMQRMGGVDTITNLVLLCLGCHRALHRAEGLAGGQGWVAWVDPDLTPVRFPCGWVLLVPDGTLERLGDAEAERLLHYMNGYATGSAKPLALVG